jgi:hypothetical protein
MMVNCQRVDVKGGFTPKSGLHETQVKSAASRKKARERKLWCGV